MPWKLVSSSSSFLSWLTGYTALLGERRHAAVATTFKSPRSKQFPSLGWCWLSSLSLSNHAPHTGARFPLLPPSLPPRLGPLIGIMLVDYYAIRGRALDVDALYTTSHAGAYWYKVGEAHMCVIPPACTTRRVRSTHLELLTQQQVSLPCCAHILSDVRALPSPSFHLTHSSHHSRPCLFIKGRLQPLRCGRPGCWPRPLPPRLPPADGPPLQRGQHPPASPLGGAVRV